MRNVTGIRIVRPGGNPDRVVPVNGEIGIRYDLPVGVRNIYFGHILQNIVLFQQELTSETLRRLVANISQQLPLSVQTFTVNHRRLLAAAIYQSLVGPNQIFGVNTLRSLNASLNQTVPVLVQQIADYFAATLSQVLPVVASRPVWGNVIAADGAYVSGPQEIIPILIQALAVPVGGAYNLRVQPLLLDKSYRYLSFENEFFEEETTGIPGGRYGEDSHTGIDIPAAYSFASQELTFLSMRFPIITVDSDYGEANSAVLFYEPPRPPSSISVARNPNSGTSLDVTWTAGLRATSYRLEHASDPLGPWTLVTSTSDLFATDANVVQDVTTYYRVRSEFTANSIVYISSWKNGEGVARDPAYVDPAINEDFESYAVGSEVSDGGTFTWQYVEGPHPVVRLDPYGSGNKVLVFGNGLISHNQGMKAVLTLNNSEAKTIEISYRFENEACCDPFVINHANTTGGPVIVALNGLGNNGAYQTLQIAAEAGVYQISFRFSKDGSVSTGQDGGFINYIKVV